MSPIRVSDGNGGWRAPKSLVVPDGSGGWKNAKQVQVSRGDGQWTKVWPETATPGTTYWLNATWSDEYNGSGSKRTDTSDLHRGYFDGTHGNQRSYIGFPEIPLLPNERITSVNVGLTAEHWFNDSGGTLHLGVHSLAAAPATAPDSALPPQVATGVWTSKTGFKWITLPLSGWEAGLRGVVLLPGPSTSQAYYSYFTDHTASSGTPGLHIRTEVI